MVKKQKAIKRVYESGKETTVSLGKKQPVSRKSRRVRSIQKKPKPSPSTSLKKLSGRSPTAAGNQRLKQPLLKKSHKPYDFKRFSDTYDLPTDYNTTQLTLMVKDPYWVYAYWDIARHSLESAKKLLSAGEFEGAAVVIRVYDVTLQNFNGSNANYSFDIDVGFYSNNWYINLWNDSISLVADLGLRTASGRFIPLARSNYVQTPRVGYSGRSEQVWMKVDVDGQSSAYTTWRAKTRGGAHSHSKSDLWNKKQKFYLSEDEIRLYYGNLSPLLREIIAARLKKRLGDPQGFRFFLEGESALERAALLRALPESFFVKKIFKGASEFLVFLDQPGHVAGSFAGSEHLVQDKGPKFF